MMARQNKLPRRTRLGLAPGLWLVVLIASGCGPIEYVNRVTQTATESLATAERDGAAVLSPYWWTRANLYLHKAREQAAHADFASANRFGRLATEAAEAASEQALANGGPGAAARARRNAQHEELDDASPQEAQPGSRATDNGNGPATVRETPSPAAPKEPRE